MKQYINKNDIVAEIERQISAIDNYPKLTDTLNIQIAVLEGNKVVLTKLLSFLDTLEVKEVDLEKEYEEFVVDDPILGNFITNDTMGMVLAKHFFELGLKTQKGE